MEEIGFVFHSVGGVYWDESVCYQFDADEIDLLESVTAELHEMCLCAVEHVITHNRFEQLAIPEAWWARVRESWRAREPSVYGRFDFSYNGIHPPKLLEYNADTPTALLEASVAQWFWLQDVKLGADQFNSIHEKLIAQWKRVGSSSATETLYFATVGTSDEDITTVEYLRDTAVQAGWSTAFIEIDKIGWWEEKRIFVDQENRPIKRLFKLYPWEWMVREEFAPQMLTGSMAVIEPSWKMLLSNKGLLPILWELYPQHPNLLPAYFTPEKFTAGYVKKPIYSREGANIEITVPGAEFVSKGEYGAEGWIYQGYAPLPVFDAQFYPVIGAWVIGDEPAGIGIREDKTPVTQNTSRFIPHYFMPLE
ncbi:MAG: glutathionylspermidine synthase family protein [Pseudomonadota bacterium]